MGGWAPRLVLSLIAAGFVAHAYHYLFLQDDAFIFFRYAENVVAGAGPVWYPGERVEGYTSPAWLAALVLMEFLPLRIESLAHVVTIALGAATLVLCAGLTRSLTGNAWAGCFAAALLAADRTFALWSSSGMDTRLFGFATMAVLALVHRLSVARRDVHDGVLVASLLLLSFSRPEGVLISGVALLFLFLCGPQQSARERLIRPAALWSAGVLAHVGWRLAYYGRPLPNTFYVKVDGLDLSTGARYLADFATSYPVFTGALLAATLFAVAQALRGRRYPLYLASVIALHCLYLLSVGGDFMEFRMLDVLLPPAAVLIASGVFALTASPGARALTASPTRAWIAAGCGTLLIASSVYAGQQFEGPGHMVSSRRWLWQETTRDWVVVGKWLARIAQPDESIATTAAGAIPYYSRLESVDMLGLNDPYFAALVNRADAKGVGHRKRVSAAYLHDRRIALVLGHPRLERTPDLAKLRPGEFYLTVTATAAEAGEVGWRRRYLAVRTTRDRVALVQSLRDRGLEVTEASREAGNED